MQNIKPEQIELDLHVNKNDKVDEEGSILVDEHIKIFDPNSTEVIIDKRGAE